VAATDVEALQRQVTRPILPNLVERRVCGQGRDSVLRAAAAALC